MIENENMCQQRLVTTVLHTKFDLREKLTSGFHHTFGPDIVKICKAHNLRKKILVLTQMRSSQQKYYKDKKAGKILIISSIGFEKKNKLVRNIRQRLTVN